MKDQAQLALLRSDGASAHLSKHGAAAEAKPSEPMTFEEWQREQPSGSACTGYQDWLKTKATKELERLYLRWFIALYDRHNSNELAMGADSRAERRANINWLNHINQLHCLTEAARVCKQQQNKELPLELNNKWHQMRGHSRSLSLSLFVPLEKSKEKKSKEKKSKACATHSGANKTSKGLMEKLSDHKYMKLEVNRRAVICHCLLLLKDNFPEAIANDRRIGNHL